MQKLLSIVLLFTGIFIALGAVGHSFFGVLKIEAVLPSHEVPMEVTKLVLAVWHFAGACMVVLGAVVIWEWWQIRKGGRGHLFIPVLIGFFYVAYGAITLAYMRTTFWAVFVVFGGCLLACALFLKSFRPQ